MQLAYVTSEQRGRTDALLGAFARRLVARGIAVAGVVQTNAVVADTGRSEMDIAVLPDGPTIRISQQLGTAAQGCRLDSAALEDAVSAASARMSPSTALLILNKFGKREADGGGFRALIAEAVAADVPVLLAVGAAQRAAFDAFAGDLACALPDCEEALADWFAQVAGKLG